MNVILLFSLFLSLLGLCEVCTSVDCQLMVYPGPKTGSIQISVCYFGNEINVIIVIIHSVCVCVWVTALNKSHFQPTKKSQSLMYNPLGFVSHWRSQQSHHREISPGSSTRGGSHDTQPNRYTLSLRFIKGSSLKFPHYYHTDTVQGTLIRIHNVQTRLLLVEFRRGADPANISWYTCDEHMFSFN